jgi:hypothetical protein
MVHFEWVNVDGTVFLRAEDVLALLSHDALSTAAGRNGVRDMLSQMIALVAESESEEVRPR